MKNLNKYFNECIAECDAIGIPYSKQIVSCTVNYRADSRWGQCEKNYRTGNYSININHRLLADDASEKGLKETILHEICHTVPDGMKHTGGWKSAVTKLNNRYGYNIKRVNTAEDKGFTEEYAEARADNKRYACRCQKCGKIIGKDRICDFIRYPSLYSHNNCGGNFVRVK